MESVEKLKPCPLCGGEAHIEHGLVTWAVVCPCSSHVFYGCEKSQAKTAEAWNTRAERTCRMEYQTGKDNPKRGWWLCNQCGGLTDSVGGRWDGRRQRMRPPAYCACCGAKVVDDD